MKILLLISLLVAVSHGGPVQEDDLQDIIDYVNTSGAKWKAGRNFDEKTTISAVKKLLGAKKNPHLKMTVREPHVIPDSAIPKEFDSRKQWPNCPSIRHIRDQGNCGSCWAVAAAGAFSDRACIASKGKFTSSLATEELLACCDECGDGCNGGFPYSAWEYFKENGLVTGGDYESKEGCQPYEVKACSHHVNGTLPPCDSFPEQDTPRCQRKCTNKDYKKSFSSDHHFVSTVVTGCGGNEKANIFGFMTPSSTGCVASAYSVNGEVTEIQKEIMAHGPVEAAFDVYADFPTYKSGVYSHVTGSFMGGHAVKIIGWGEEEGSPYWLVANEWNQDWGDKGLFKIARGSDECGFESGIVAGVPKV